MGPEKTDGTLDAKQISPPETKVCSVEVARTQTEGDFNPAKQQKGSLPQKEWKATIWRSARSKWPLKACNEKSFEEMSAQRLGLGLRCVQLQHPGLPHQDTIRLQRTKQPIQTDGSTLIMRLQILLYSRNPWHYYTWQSC